MTEKHTTGHVVALLRRPGARAATEDVEELELSPEEGVAGDHGSRRRRQLTLLSEEAWTAALAELEVDLPWQTRRANVLLRGIDLRYTVGRQLRLGACIVLVNGETRPCGNMERAAAGLERALAPEWRGGVYAEVVRGGVVRPGDDAVLE